MSMCVGNVEAEGAECLHRRWGMPTHGQISLPSSHVNLNKERGPLHINTYPLFLCHLDYAITGNTLVIREIFSSGTWSSTFEVTQAIQFTCPCTPLWGEPNLGTFGTLSLKCLCDLNSHTNANSPSVISGLGAAVLLNSASVRNLWRPFFIAR